MTNCARLRTLVDPMAESMADGERLTALVVEGQRAVNLIDALKPFAKQILRWTFEYGDVDGTEILEKAKELGLVIEVPYDPEVHQHLGLDADIDEGDPIWIESELLK